MGLLVVVIAILVFSGHCVPFHLHTKKGNNCSTFCSIDRNTLP